MPVFRLCGFAGFALALLTTGVLFAESGLSGLAFGGVMAAGVATFLLVSSASEAVLSRERLVFYHHALAVTGSSALVLALLGQPLLAGLDAVAAGLLALDAAGRAGCTVGGCCHGRPANIGIRYRHEHAAHVNPHLVGPALVPVQPLEGIIAAVLAGAAIALVFGGAAPGAALSTAALGYAAARFWLERWRGDVRPIIAGLSEAQWTSLLIIAAVVVAQAAGALPGEAWHAIVAGVVAAGAMLRWARVAVGDPVLAIEHPEHVRELAAASDLVRRLQDGPAPEEPTVDVAGTALGVTISTGTVLGPQGPIDHLTLGRRDRPLEPRTAVRLAHLLRVLRGHRGTAELVGGHRVYHLVLHPTAKRDRPPA